MNLNKMDTRLKENRPMATTTDPYGTLHPDYDEAEARFRIYVQRYDKVEEDGWHYKLTFIDRKYQDSDGLPIDAVCAGNSWTEAFAKAGEWIERALATDHCIF